jgi:hypothetical protein
MLALDQLEDGKLLLVQLFEAVDRGDVGMIQGCEQVRFTTEAGESLGVLRLRPAPAVALLPSGR